MSTSSKLQTSEQRSNAGSKGGRPVNGTLEQRLEQLLSDATRIFIEQGYGSTTLDWIAREAHVAKRTIYQNFGNKEQLFGAVVRRRASSLFKSFPDIDAEEGSLKSVLSRFAHELLAIALSPEGIGLERIIIGEASRFPKLAEQFYSNGPAQAIALLEQYLVRQQQLGALQLSDPKAASTQFFSLVLGEFQRRALLDVEQPYPKEQIGRHVDGVVLLFLAAYGLDNREN